jgi:Flp pilus assembly protein TadG
MTPRTASRSLWQRGQSVVELALVLPVLVLLMLALVDLSRAIQAYNIISNMSREGANLTARSSIDHEQIMDALARTAQPLKMSEQGMMYITEVRGVAGSNSVVSPLIFSQQGWQGRSSPPSKVNSGTVAAAVDGITLSDGDTVYIFEVFYQYRSLFNSSDHYQALSPQLHSVSIF